jgi:hypothetical protein
VQRRFRRECEVRIPGFWRTPYTVASGSHHTLCSLWIAATCPAGTPRSVRAAKGVVTLTGVSVSLYAVSGASTRGTIDESETNNTPNTTTVQRKYFKGRTQVASMLLASGLSVKVEQIGV